MRTGVQFAINVTVFKLLNMNQYTLKQTPKISLIRKVTFFLTCFCSRMGQLWKIWQKKYIRI